MHSRNNLGRAIHAERIAAVLTQDELAARLQISRPTLTMLETRSRRPDAETLPKLCQGWPDKSAGLRILVEHLRDEITRAAVPDGAITISPTTPTEISLQHVHAMLRALRSQDAHLYSHVVALLEAITTATATHHDADGAHVDNLAADGPGPTWTTDTHRRRKS